MLSSKRGTLHGPGDGGRVLLAVELGLRHKVALVTGGSKGIGRAIALEFAREGARVAVCARGEPGLEKVVREIERRGGEALGHAADLSRSEAIVGLVKATLRRFHQLDIVVNNAGSIGRFLRVQTLADEDWEEAIALNLMSVVRMSRETLPALSKTRGCLINIATVGGHQPDGAWPHYDAAKAAVMNLSKAMANDLGRSGVRVHCVCPGPVWTPSWDEEVAASATALGLTRQEAADRKRAQVEPGIPLGRIGAPKDVASLVVFLASAKAGWMTGTCINVDGGLTRSAS